VAINGIGNHAPGREIDGLDEKTGERWPTLASERSTQVNGVVPGCTVTNEDVLRVIAGYLTEVLLDDRLDGRWR
jgi:hypothetical protein